MVIKDFKILEKLLKPTMIYNLYHFKPVIGFSIDSRTLKSGEAFIAIQGRHLDGHKFIKNAVKRGASFIVAQEYFPVKPKVPFFVVDNTYDALGAIASCVRKKKKPLVYGITGSIGKTTTKEILSFLLKPYFTVLKNKKTENNVLGLAKTIFSLKDEKIMILELGTNKRGEIESLAKTCSPDIGIITSIKPVHLQGLRSLQGICREKLSLLKANARMKVVLNRDDRHLVKAASKFSKGRKVYWFGKDKNCRLYAYIVNRENGNSRFLIQDKYELTLPCYLESFITNILAAILGAHLIGIPLGKLMDRISNFKDFPPMRMQMRKIKKFLILNDAYNANPYSFIQALNSLKNYPFKKIAVVADMLELGKKSVYYHERLALSIVRGNFDYCLSLGQYTIYLKNKLRQLGYKKAFHFQSHKDIARFIKRKIKTGRIDPKRYLIFLKGSRKMELEKVIDYL